MNKKIVFIGLGRMGSAMATQLLKAGISLTVYNRTKKKAASLVELGAHLAESLDNAVVDADIIFTSLMDDSALKAVTAAMLPNMKKSAIHVSTSTILPKTAEQLEQQHLEASCFYVSSLVLGVPKAVIAKRAMSIVSGNVDKVEDIKPLIEAYSDSILYMGEKISHANVLKIYMNYSLISAIELISELYAYAEKSGVDTEIVKESLKHIYSQPAILLYIDKIHARNFDEVNFDIQGGNKDINLFIEAFMEVGVTPDIANTMQGKFAQAMENNMGSKDWSAVSDIVRQRS